MPVTTIVGAQWGDEGKGRIVDYLAQRADVILRFQGGDNAGHTVVNEHGRFALHILPSGMFNPSARNIVAAGTVVNPDQLLKELAGLERAGIDTSSLVVDRRAHLVMPYHPLLDALQETARADGDRIGTTKRGIGPTYVDKAARVGLRAGDLLDLPVFAARLAPVLEAHNARILALGGEPLALDGLLDRARMWADRLAHRIVDTLPMLQTALRGGEQVLLEGQLGAMRDLDWGTYPFVTSSNPIAGHASVGAGIPARELSRVIGVVKAYGTAVGAGPFPAELLDETGARLAEEGREVGTTTGRPRRCGWLDAVALAQASWLNGFTELAVTKLDVLDGFAEIGICVAYECDGEQITHVPDSAQLERCRPVLEMWPGWMTPTVDARDWKDLPEAARAFLRRIEELGGAPLSFVSVGPERDALIRLGEARA